jgi:hypothetical protein
MEVRSNNWGWGRTPAFTNTGAGNCPVLQSTGDTVKFNPVLWPDDTNAQNGYGLFVTVEASTTRPSLHLYYTTTFYDALNTKAYCDGIDEYFALTPLSVGITKFQLPRVGTVLNGNPPAGSLLAGGFVLVDNDLDSPLRIVSVTLEPIP